jgi:hypothetical protein
VLDNRNNNKDKNNDVEDLEDTEVIEEGGDSTNNKMKTGYKKTNNDGKNQSNSIPNARRNTGKFDKHRQKDKVFKKSAHFNL